jgi:hypothetical protein
MLGRLFGRRSVETREEPLFVAPDEVRTRQDSIDRGVALDAAHLTPARRVGLVALGAMALGQSSLQTQNGSAPSFIGSLSQSDAFVRKSKP